MKYILLIFLLGLSCYGCAQKQFNWADSTFKVGQKKIIRLEMAYDGPCTVIPCYTYGNNRLKYDTLITFLNNHKGVSVAFLWHTATGGSSQYNFHYSKKAAEGLLSTLKEKGISENRITAIGLGESQPVINQQEIMKIDDRTRRFEAEMKNKRIEMIITAVPK